MARFFSGGGTSYKQGGRTFEFDWRPAEIEWFGDRGESHVYSARSALAAGAPDHTQCLPADMEVRMNLWHLFGSSRPTGMEDHHIVEVVIDNFAFVPSGLTAVPERGVCTKDCQCGSSSSCTGNVCQSSGRKLEEEEDLGMVNGTESIYRPFMRSSTPNEQSEFASIGAVALILVAAAMHVYLSKRAYPRHEGISQSLINHAV